MTTINIEDVQSRLEAVIAGLNPGEPLVIVQGGQPVATLTRNPEQSWPCQAGSAKDKILWISSDFDAPLEDFEEYMD